MMFKLPILLFFNFEPNSLQAPNWIFLHQGSSFPVTFFYLVCPTQFLVSQF